MTTDTGRAFGWDDEIQNDESFSVIPEGEYDFRVIKYERKRYEGGAKIPACNKATLHLELSTADGIFGKVNTDLILHSSIEWKISAFFRSIGLKKHGEKLAMDWPKVPGAYGKCKISMKKYKKKDGTEAESNEVNFLDPAADVPATDKGW
jgi:hypothetical protein